MCLVWGGALRDETKNGCEGDLRSSTESVPSLREATREKRDMTQTEVVRIQNDKLVLRKIFPYGLNATKNV